MQRGLPLTCNLSGVLDLPHSESRLSTTSTILSFWLWTCVVWFVSITLSASRTPAVVICQLERC